METDSSATPPPIKKPQSHTAGTRMLIPVGRSGYAIAAGYLGLLALFLGVPGPFAVLLGILGLRDIKKSRESSGETKHGSVRCWFGIATGVIGTCWVAFAIASTFSR